MSCSLIIGIREFLLWQKTFGMGLIQMPYKRCNEENYAKIGIGFSRSSRRLYEICPGSGIKILFIKNCIILDILYQAPDVCWNAPFKSKIREYHSNWMVHGEKPTTSGGNLKAPEIETYLQWVYDAWESISKESIIKCFILALSQILSMGARMSLFPALRFSSTLAQRNNL